MSKKIVAIGGGLNGRKKTDGTYEPYETYTIDKEIVEIVGRDKPNFLFLAHSQDKEAVEESYFITMRNIYETKFGCECKHLKRKDLIDKEKVDELVNWSDIIYEGGGNTLDMINLWKETGFDEILQKAWENGKVMCGVSAGANCWFKECSSDSLQIKYGKDYPLIKVDCIGLIDGLFVPHCDESGREENVKEFLKDSLEVGILISNCCALEIIDDKYRLVTSESIEKVMKPYGLKTYWKDGKYITEEINNSSEFKELKDLLSKKN